MNFRDELVTQSVSLGYRTGHWHGASYYARLTMNGRRVSSVLYYDGSTAHSRKLFIEMRSPLNGYGIVNIRLVEDKQIDRFVADGRLHEVVDLIKTHYTESLAKRKELFNLCDLMEK